MKKRKESKNTLGLLKSSSKYLVLLGTGVIILVVVLVFIFINLSSGNKEKSPPSITDSQPRPYSMTMTTSEKKTYWEEQLATRDPDDAYSLFSSLYENEDYGVQHTDLFPSSPSTCEVKCLFYNY